MEHANQMLEEKCVDIDNLKDNKENVLVTQWYCIASKNQPYQLIFNMPNKLYNTPKS